MLSELYKVLGHRALAAVLFGSPLTRRKTVALRSLAEAPHVRRLGRSLASEIEDGTLRSLLLTWLWLGTLPGLLFVTALTAADDITLDRSSKESSSRAVSTA